MGAHYLRDALSQLRKYKRMADAAIAQVSDEDFFRAPDPESNSIALMMKHVAGNMRSRWRDFLTSDGEKPDRDRDSEFERDAADSRESLTARWEAGWTLLFQALEPIREGDLLREGADPRRAPHGARGDPAAADALRVPRRADRLRRQAFAGTRWKSLSIPKGKSREFDVAKSGRPYTVGKP